MRVVLDPNVLISPSGAPRQFLAAWVDGALQARRQPGAARRAMRRTLNGPSSAGGSAAPSHASSYGLADDALVLDDPPALLAVSPDPGDDYLIALARHAEADFLVSGDRHLLDLHDPHPPVLAPRPFLEAISAFVLPEPPDPTVKPTREGYDR